MAEILNMQEGQPETPREEKASNKSWGFCRNSYQSWAFCIVK